MKRVLIIHPEGNSYNNPTMKAIIDLLLDNNIQVTIRYGKSAASMPIYRGVILRPWGRLYGRIKRQVLNVWSSFILMNIIMLFEYFSLRKKYDLIIGVDREGIIEASFWSKYTGASYVFISFEIMFLSETSKRFKKIEVNAAKKASRWLVQDIVRAEQLISENNLDDSKQVILPMASKGIGLYKPNRLRDKIGIPKDKNVVIMMGSMTDWSMSSEILYSVVDWPDDWCLMVHERYGNTKKYIASLRKTQRFIDESKIYISDKTVDMVDDMGEVLSGVSIGLAFYQPSYKNCYTGKNLKYLGLSSGKISSMLRYGVPLIMNEIGVYSNLAIANNFGVVVNSPKDISKELSMCDVNLMSRYATKFYASYLDFAKYEDMIWRDLLWSLNVN